MNSSVVVRNDTKDSIIISYDNVEIELIPNKAVSFAVVDFGKLFIPTSEVKISHGVINIKELK